MSALPRWVGLPLAALILVIAVIGVQLANGGGTYEPLKSADPCATRDVTSQSDGIEGLTERLVLLGIDNAACSLRVTREALTLELAQPGARTDAEIDALREGLRSAVDDMKADGTLPPASDLVDEALQSADLNGLLKTAIRALPGSVVDAAVRTDDVLDRAIRELDLRELLANLENQDELEQQVGVAVTAAVKASVTDRLRNLL